MEKNKRILIVTATLFVIAALSIGSYYLFSTRDNGGVAQNIMRNFFPSAIPKQESDTTVNTAGGQGTDNAIFETEEGSEEQITLRKISASPVAGAVIVENGGRAIVRYIERETGHVFDVATSSPEVARVTNTTILRVRDALWSADGLHVALQYLNEDLETVETFLATVTIGNASSEGELQGVFLPENIVSLAVNNVGTEFVYVEKLNEGARGVRVNTSGKHVAQIFSSPFFEWRVSYRQNGDISLLSKPSANVSGFFYAVTAGGVFDRLLGDTAGLTALESPSKSYIAFSRSEGGKVAFSAIDETTGTISELSLSTFPEKCVWSANDSDILFCFVPNNFPSAVYPDSWYQGLVSFNDTLWKIDLKTETYEKLLDLEAITHESLDGIKPSISQNDSILIFTNKKDSSLWSIALPKEQQEVEDVS